jgi:hypothetical protein
MPSASLAAIVAPSFIAMALPGRRPRDLAAVTQHQRDCTLTAKEYRQLNQRVPAKVTAIVPRYNEQRHQSLVEISSERTENGGKSLYDEIIDPKTDELIASRMRDVGEQGERDNTVISGAPVRLDTRQGLNPGLKD